MLTGETLQQRPGKYQRQVRIVPKYNLVYLVNQKAGCSTIKLMLGRLYLNDWTYTPRGVHRTDPVPGPKDLGWGDTATLLGGGGARFYVRAAPRTASGVCIPR